jgi:hypothetical protein
MHALLVIGAVLGLLAIAGGSALVVCVVRIGLVLIVTFFAYAIYDITRPTLSDRCSADPSRTECRAAGIQTTPGFVLDRPAPADCVLRKPDIDAEGNDWTPFNALPAPCHGKTASAPVVPPAPKRTVALQALCYEPPPRPSTAHPHPCPGAPDSGVLNYPAAPQAAGAGIDGDDLSGAWGDDLKPASARADRMLRGFHKAQGVEMDP